jgi:hypothetical protein
MPSITIEVQEAEERLQELTDAVLQGQDVWITHCGEPVAVASLQHMTGDEPPAGLRDAVLALLGASVRHLCDRLPSDPCLPCNPCCLN